MTPSNCIFLGVEIFKEKRSGSLDAPPIPLLQPCEFNSCPTGSPAVGFNASNPRLNHVNSFPVTSMRYGVETLSPKFFGGAPDIAVAGPNVGCTILIIPPSDLKITVLLSPSTANLGLATLLSGTVGAATAAVSKDSTPGLAFSGSAGAQTAWTAPTPSYASIYADLSTNLTQTLVASGKPYLPPNVWLNVNFPAVTDSACASPAAFKFVLSRIYAATIFSSPDVATCGTTRLPSESSVVGTSGGCYASVSVGHADTKLDATAAQQGVVLGKLKGILSCLP